MSAERERGIKPAEVVQLRDKLKERLSHVETVYANHASVLEFSCKHVLAVVGIGPAIEALLRAVVQAGNAACRIKKGKGDRKALVSAGVQEARLVVVVQKRDQAHLRVGVVVGGDLCVMTFDLVCAARGGRKGAVDRKIQRVIQH